MEGKNKVKKKKSKNHWTFADIYCDEGISGTSLKHRDNFLRMIEDCHAGKIDLIVDGGKCEFSFESTVIDMVKFPYVVIRKGCLDCKKLLEYI